MSEKNKKKRIAHGNIMSFFNKKSKENDEQEQPSTSSLITVRIKKYIFISFI